MVNKNVADVIIQQLAAWGVRNIYGYIGDDIFFLLDALARQNTVRFYQVKHEESAALMASAHAKLTGELGVCIADGGPGTLHLLNGLADAYTDRVPVLAITGQVSLKDIGTNAKQYLNQQVLMSAITAYSDQIADPKATIKVLERAYRTAITSRSVAHISVPMDLLASPCDEQVLPCFPYLTNHPISPPEVINGALDRLNQARKPVILVGEGGRNAGALISDLASKWGAGIITTLAGTGAVDSSHPLFIGGLGQAGSPASTTILNEADFLLLLGANWWPQKYVPQNTPMVQIDITPENIGATTTVSYGLLGETSIILKALVIGVNTNSNMEWRDRIENEKKAWLTELENETKSDISPLHPAAVIKALEKVIPDNALICLDTGDNTVWFGRVFRPAKQRVLVSGKWRTMGFGLPAAISAKLCLPSQKVIALVGDGGFTMTMAEFITAVKYNLPVMVVILNNKELAMEKNKMLAGGLIPKGTELLNPNFAGYANDCGGVGIRVENYSELEKSLLEGLNAERPVIIDINTAAVTVPGTSLPS